MSESGASSGTAMLGCAAVFIGAIAVGLLALIGVLTLAGLRDVHQQAYLMESAEPVTAVITRSEVLQITTLSDPRSPAARVTTYLPDVEFRVTGSARSLTGDQIYPTAHSGDETWAKEMVDRYPVGREVSAWIAPDGDDTAFLEKIWVTDHWAFLFGIAVSLSILMSIVSVSSFLFPPVSRSVAGIGLLGSFVLSGYTITHYLSTAGGDHLGLGLPEIFGVIAILFAFLPWIAWRRGQRWYRRLQADDA